MLTPMSLIEVGTLGRPHGVHGEMSLHHCSLTPLELHELKTFTFRGVDGKSRTLTLATARPANDKIIVRFAGIGDRDAAATLTRGRVMVERERLPDPGENVAYTFQLIGLDVVTDEGRTVGQVAEVWPTPANTVLVVRGGATAGEVLIPAVEPFVSSVDLAAKRITVRLLPGMESEEKPPSGE
jgi:16S rRNA processing protein RimM